MGKKTTMILTALAAISGAYLEHKKPGTFKKGQDTVKAGFDKITGIFKSKKED